MLARGRITHEDVFNALHEVATAATSGFDPERIARLAADRCRALLDVDGVAVRRLDAVAERLELLAAATVRAGEHPPDMPLQGSLVGRSVLQARTIVVDDYQSQPTALLWARSVGIQSIMVVPLLVGSSPVGAISVFTHTRRSFTREEEQLVELLAAAIGPALESARLQAEVAQSESWLREAYQAIACGVVEVTVEGVIEMNLAAREILRADLRIDTLSATEVAPVSAAGAVIRVWDEDGRELASSERPLAAAFVTRQPVRAFTGQVQIADGPRPWIHGQAVPLFDATGAVDRVIFSFIDISAMKKAEEAARRSEALFKEAFENSPLGMHITSVDGGRILQANRALHTILGYEHGSLVGTPLSDLTRDGSDEVETAQRRRRLIDGAVPRVLHRRQTRTRDGRLIFMEVNVGLVRDSAGKALYTVTQLADVTQQVHAEDVLREEAGRMIEIVKAQTEAYDNDLAADTLMKLLADRARRLTGAASATVRLLAGTRVVARADSGAAAVGSCPAADNVEGTFAGHCAAGGEAILTGEAGEDDRAGVAERGAGARSLAASPLRHGGHVTGVIEVRSERPGAFGERETRTLGLLAGLAAAAIGRTEMIGALRHSEARFKGAFHSSGIGMTVMAVKPEPCLLTVNDALCGMLGYAESELLGRPSNSLFHADDLQAGTAALRAIVDGEIETYRGTRRLVHKSGRTVWTRLTASILRGDEKHLVLAQLEDITDSVAAQDQLRASERRNRAIVEAALDCIVVVDAKGRITEFNPAAERTFGYARSEVMGRPMVQLLLSSYVRGRHLKGFARTLGGDLGKVIGNRVEMTALRADGSEFPIEISIAALDQRPAMFAASIRDLSVRDRLRASEEHLAAMVAGAPLVVLAIDRQGIITLCAGQGVAAAGSTAEELVGTSIYLLDGGREDIAEGVELALAGQTSVRVGRSSSRGRDFETRYSPVRDDAGAVTGLIAVSYDVTERVAAERELVESRARLAAVVANSPVILFAIDAAGVVQLAEGAGLLRLGLEAGGPVGQNVRDVFGGAPEAIRHLEAGLAGESFEGLVHLPLLEADFDARYGPIRDGEGRVIGVSGMATDVTDRIRAEAALHENEAKSRLMAIMNHEVRTPLNSVLGFAELLRSGHAGELNSKQRRYVSNVEVAGRHLLSLVNDSLDLAKLDADKMPADFHDLLLEPILDQAISQVEPIGAARGVTMIAECAGDLGVCVDRRRLLQVLWNLLSNAIKHSKTGGTIWLRASADGEQVIVNVVDHGSGIPTEQLEGIFEEFHQVGASQVDGTGLGLAVSRRLMALMEGTITVVSEEGHGSTFTITLKRASVVG